jgi:hypothetical protein
MVKVGDKVYFYWGGVDARTQKARVTHGVVEAVTQRSLMLIIRRHTGKCSSRHAWHVFTTREVLEADRKNTPFERVKRSRVTGKSVS